LIFFLNSNYPSLQQSLANLNANHESIFKPAAIERIQEQPTKPENTEVVQSRADVELPTEYQNIKVVFDDLLQKSLELSTTAIVKRKLDDVRKKLEVLYSKLKESSVRRNKRKNHGGLKRKFGTPSYLKKNMWKNGRPPQKTEKKICFSCQCTHPRPQKKFFFKDFFLNFPF